jgi:branched-chain amino acid transport system substrate-binding protein
MQKCQVSWIIILSAFLMVTISFPAWAAKTIKIGVIGPMLYVQGEAQWNGARLAADQINAKGGIRVGRQKMKIELIKADSNEFNSVTDAANAMSRLVSQDKVNFVVGGFRSEAVLVMQDIAMESKVIFIGVGASANELCTRVADNYNTYKYWFRESPFNSTYLARTAFIHLAYVAEIMKRELKIPKLKVAVVAEKALWADAFTKTAEMVVTQQGMDLVGTWRPSAVATDVSAEVPISFLRSSLLRWASPLPGRQVSLRYRRCRWGSMWRPRRTASGRPPRAAAIMSLPPLLIAGAWRTTSLRGPLSRPM